MYERCDAILFHAQHVKRRKMRREKKGQIKVVGVIIEEELR
jgi:hypothetical protein